MNELPEFNVDPSEAAKQAERDARIAEAHAWLAQTQKETLQRENRQAAVELGLIDTTQAAAIRELQGKQNELEFMALKLQNQGLRKLRGGGWTDSQGNKYDEEGNYIE